MTLTKSNINMTIEEAVIYGSIGAATGFAVVGLILTLIAKGE